MLRDEIHLATPPPHPSDVPAPNNNPLATTTSPPTAGTKLSLAIIAPSRPPSQALFRINTFNSTRSNVPHSISEELSQEQDGPELDTNGTGTSAFGQGNPALAAPVNGKIIKDVAKKGKPKNNIVKSNSSFVSRVIPHEALQKRLTERSLDGIFAFVNINRAMQWLDLSSDTKVSV